MGTAGKAEGPSMWSSRDEGGGPHSLSSSGSPLVITQGPAKGLSMAGLELQCRSHPGAKVPSY